MVQFSDFTKIFPPQQNHLNHKFSVQSFTPTHPLPVKDIPLLNNKPKIDMEKI